MNIQITPNFINTHTNKPKIANNNRSPVLKNVTVDQCTFGNNDFQLIPEDDSVFIKSIKFDKPIEVAQAFSKIASSDNQLLVHSMWRKTHSIQILENLANFLSQNPIGKIKVKSLEGFGAFAFAFETTDGKILKITETDHFPNGRKPAKFDLPIIKSGRLNKYPPYHYYIEEKVTQEGISQEELRALVKEIKSLGYRMKDYLIHYDETFKGDIKTEQFGKTKDGKLYLIDPGCALETDLVYNGIKKYNLKTILKKLF